MKFYDRLNEIRLLTQTTASAKNNAKMTVVTGRRRIGKTSLILKAADKTDFVYLFVSRKKEVLLCADFIEEIQRSLNITIYGEFKTFRLLFEYLMELSTTRHFTLIIDEFQEFANIVPSIFSDMQQIWDRRKEQSKMHLIVSGSVHSLMKKIFENAKEPLFGRANEHIYLKPFSVDILKEIMADNYPQYSSFDLLSFYIFTGGVAKYVEMLVDKKALSFTKMVDEIFRENSFWMDEGKNLLIEEFGKEYTTYFSILSLIACSKTSRTDIESILENKVGGYLERLEVDYQILRPVKPIFAKPGSRSQKYLIEDNFLNFWFRFVFKYKNALEAGNFAYLKEIINRDFRAYSGKFLEKWFIEKIKLSGRCTNIGSFWDKGDNEIDIVAVDERGKTAIIAEVKLDKTKINLPELKRKALKLSPQLIDYRIEYQMLSLEDM